ncbi:MAG TPA: hypothetical protein VFQ45_02625, partial [Longimicrobium sp.]|nr:hypothetical protein [Longimicrobium sp.]
LAAYCWGGNSAGQLGDGSTAPSEVPRPVAADSLVQVAAGERFTCGTTLSRGVQCWGDNSLGQLGDGGTASRTTAAAVALPPGVAGGVRGTAAGRHHACAAAASGQVACWGANGSGQLGTPSTAACGTPATPCAPLPAVVPGTGAAVFAAAAATYTCALGQDERAACWGVLPWRDGTPVSPQPTAPLLLLTRLATGADHACGLTPAGFAYCWGMGGWGQLGTDRVAVRCGGVPCTPVPVPVEGGILFSQIAAGDGFTCGLATNERIYCWGRNDRGQRGAPAGSAACGGQPCETIPRPVEGLHRFSALGTGAAHACAVTPQGRLYCWGRNDQGQLGVGDRLDRSLPTPVLAPLVAAEAAAGR